MNNSKLVSLKIKLPKTLAKQLKSFAKTTNQPLSYLVFKAIDKYQLDKK